MQDLRIKGELLDRKLTEVDQLKLRINEDQRRRADQGYIVVPDNTAYGLGEDEINKQQQGYQTFPKQKSQNPPKTPDRPAKQVAALRKSSNARHSVQICQVELFKKHKTFRLTQNYCYIGNPCCIKCERPELTRFDWNLRARGDQIET